MHLRASLRAVGYLGLLLFVVLGLHPADAGSATWIINPQMEDWNLATNWTPNTIPNSPNDTATFAGTNGSQPVIHSDIELNTLLFTPDAPAPITITVGDPSSQAVASLTLSGAGIVNNTDYFQLYTQAVQAAPTRIIDGARNIIYMRNDAGITEGDGLTTTGLIAAGGAALDLVGGQIQFLDDSSAGGPGFTSQVSALPGFNGGGGGEVWFFDNSSAGSAGVFSGAGQEVGSKPGITYFMGTSTADNAYINNSPTQAAGVEGGKTFFLESSTAGDSLIYAGGGAYGDGAGGGTVIFSDTASAGDSRLVAYGGLSGGLDGSFQFVGDSTGEAAEVELSRTGNLIISGHNPPGIAIGSLSDGSLEGSGIVMLGANNLAVGSNNLTTTFSGSIEGSGGSLTKVGTGTLTLTANSTYTGNTTVSGGILILTNREGSATGTGPLNILTSTLAGDGTIGGPVSLRKGALVAPSVGAPRGGSRKLTIQGKLSLMTGSTYQCQLKLSGRVQTDRVCANVVTIRNKARFVIVAQGQGQLALGQNFVVLDNTGADPIQGAFDNLAEGAIIAVQGNNLQATYQGGDGNDLTLTVVP